MGEKSPIRVLVAVDGSEHAERAARVEVRHRFGNPADEILAEAQEREPDLIVVGRRGLSAPGRWLIGSVSDRVVRHAHAPVLVVS